MRFQSTLNFFVMAVLATSVMAAPQGKGRSGGGKSSSRSTGSKGSGMSTGQVSKSGMNAAKRGGTTTGSVGGSAMAASSVPNPYAGKNPYQTQSAGKSKTTAQSSAKAAGKTSTGNQSQSRDLSNASPEVQKLASDLEGIKSGSQVTQAQKDDLKNSLTAMADGATKPDPVLVEDLSSDLSSALSDGNLSTKEMAQLSSDLEKVMNSANIPMSEVQAAIVSAQTLLTASGVDKADVQLVVADLQAIAKSAQSKAAGAKSNASSKTRPRMGGRRGG